MGCELDSLRFHSSRNDRLMQLIYQWILCPDELMIRLPIFLEFADPDRATFAKAATKSAFSNSVLFPFLKFKLL